MPVPVVVPSESVLAELSVPVLPAAAGADSLRVGDYLVGNIDCPHLLGHPDIRY